MSTSSTEAVTILLFTRTKTVRMRRSSRCILSQFMARSWVKSLRIESDRSGEARVRDPVMQSFLLTDGAGSAPLRPE